MVLMGQVAFALLAQQREAAFAEEQLLAALVAQQLEEVVSSNAPRLAVDSAFWAQPATANARQMPTVAIMVFMVNFPLKDW